MAGPVSLKKMLKAFLVANFSGYYGSKVPEFMKRGDAAITEVWTRVADHDNDGEL